jgi:CRP-like cAMP-binding protein
MDEQSGLRLSNLLSIDPSGRNLAVILEITQLLASTLLLQTVAEQLDMQAAVETCARKMRLKWVSAGDTVQSAASSEFFFIVKGRVEISASHAAQPVDVTAKKVSFQPRRRMTSILSRSILAKSDLAKAVVIKAEATEASAGQSFGDLGLVTSIPEVTATAVLNTQLAYLSYAEFTKTIRKVKARLYSEKVSFLASLLPFKQLTEKGLHRVASSFRYKAYHRREAVYAEGGAADAVFIIISGEFEFSKTYKAQGRSSSTVRSYTRRTVQRLFTRSPKEFFGHEDLFEGRSRFVGCWCLSAKGEVYSIDSSDFTALIIQGPPGQVLRTQYREQERFLRHLIYKSEDIRQLTDTPYSSLTPTKEFYRSSSNGSSSNRSLLRPSLHDEQLLPGDAKVRARRSLTTQILSKTVDPGEKRYESPGRYSSSQANIRQTSFTGRLKQRLDESPDALRSISEIRKTLMKDALKPSKQTKSAVRLKDRSLLRKRLESMLRDDSIKQILMKQWEPW